MFSQRSGPRRVLSGKRGPDLPRANPILIPRTSLRACDAKPASIGINEQDVPPQTASSLLAAIRPFDTDRAEFHQADQCFRGGNGGGRNKTKFADCLPVAAGRTSERLDASADFLDDFPDGLVKLWLVLAHKTKMQRPACGGSGEELFKAPKVSALRRARARSRSLRPSTMQSFPHRAK